MTSTAIVKKDVKVEVAAAAETKIDAALRTRIVRARIRLDEGAELLRPGLEVDVEGDARVVESALVIPSDALVFGETGNIVFVIDRGVARVRDVRVGYTTYAIAEILGGLTEGELVVVTGKDVLADGRRARIEPRSIHVGSIAGSLFASGIAASRVALSVSIFFIVNPTTARFRGWRLRPAPLRAGSVRCRREAGGRVRQCRD